MVPENFLYSQCGRHPPQIRLYPQGLFWNRCGIRSARGSWGKSELWIRFKTFHRLTNTARGCQVYLFRWGHSSNLFLGDFYWILDSHWDGPLVSRFSSLFWVFPQPVSIPGICHFPLISSGFPNIINVLSHDGAQHGYQCPTPCAGDRLDYLGFHSCSCMWPPNQGLQRKGLIFN